MKNIIIQKNLKMELDSGILIEFQALTFACIALIVIGVSLFCFRSTQPLSVRERLQEFRTNYVNVSKNLDS